jgi:hypothetical protein
LLSAAFPGVRIPRRPHSRTERCATIRCSAG